jgi:single-strand DNA-binding protein
MAGSLNKVTLIGRVGKDPEIRTAGSTDVASFSLATSETWKDKRSGERKEKTEWHNIVVWPEGTVNFISEHVEKGDLLYVEGQLQTREYDDKEGVKRRTTEIVVQGFGGSVQLLGKKGEGKGEGRGEDDRGSRSSDRGSRSSDRGSSASDRGSRSSDRGSNRSRETADLDDDIPF